VTINIDTIVSVQPSAVTEIDTITLPKFVDEPIIVDLIPEPEIVIVPVIQDTVRTDSIHENIFKPDTLMPEPGIVLEETDPIMTIDTIPIEWVKDTMRILPPQDTIVVVITDPDTLMAMNQYNLAAQYWKLEKQQDMDHFTIVLMYACSGTTVDSVKKILTKPNDLFILPKDVDNRSCFIICWGDFKTREDAEKRFETIPAWFAENGLVPMVRPLFKIDRLTRLSLTRLIIENDHVKRE